MDITLPPQIEQALTEEANRRGTTPELLALDCLRERFLPEPTPQPPAEGETLADFLEGYIGIFASEAIVPGGARMSEKCGEKFAEGMARKRRQGRL